MVEGPVAWLTADCIRSSGAVLGPLPVRTGARLPLTMLVTLSLDRRRHSILREATMLVAPFLVFLSLSMTCISGKPVVPSVRLSNAARPGLMMPAVGLGTGGYGTKDGKGGEYWDPAQGHNATVAWLQLGGPRIDASDDYQSVTGVGSGWVASGVSREDIFITSKINPHGYDQALQDFAQNLKDLQTEYVDLLLIHWPGTQPGTTPPPPLPCKEANGTWAACRLGTWKALEKIYNAGQARAIGVSNYEVNHLLEIMNLKSLIPSVNQVEFHPYWHEDQLLYFCQQHNITFNSYSPIGAPDHAVTLGPSWNAIPDLRTHPNVTQIAQKHNMSPAQVIMRWHWQQGIVINPRTRDPVHMAENMDIFNFALDTDDMKTLSYLEHPTISKVCGDPRLIL
eukprot:TRINITY_DN8017_c0_g1_i3.p1 TRINITY_DN8017_c0_g1~~TRINITY_DN8017_c0_g1_i3.p1  ORF type:complete len:395 (+),score=83.42 TRINITY_DN8017_c0_g1_i3:22-1206(+)